MRNPIRTIVTVGLASGGLALAGGPLAAQADPAHTHMGHVLDQFRGTPEGQGLLPTAVAEAAVAATHAGLAARDLSNLDAMKRHAGHVLNALDPSEAENGPGLGYGVKAAATRVARHIELAARSEGASQNVKTHATHVATSANNTVARADRMIELAKAIQGSDSAESAAESVQELNTLAAALTAGIDADDNGRVGWQEGEGGLDATETHMGLMQRGEG